jgi:hypothetical protein
MKKLIFTFLLTVCFFSVLLAQTPSSTPDVIQAQASEKHWLDYVLALTQILGIVGLAIYVYKTWEIATANKTSAEMSQKSIEMSQKSVELTQKSVEISQRSVELSQAVLEEMKTSRLQEIAPQVVIYIDMPYNNDFVMYLVVKNTGKTIAKDIKFLFEPTLMTGFGETPKEMSTRFLKEGISSLAPEQEIRTTFDVISDYPENELPMSYKVQVDYASDLQSERISSEHIIDLTMFKQVSVLSKKTEQDFFTAVEHIAESSSRTENHFRHLSEAFNSGIWIRNPEIAFQGIVNNSEEWTFVTLTKLKEFNNHWNNIYANNYQRPVTLYTENLQSRLAIFSSQILLLCANAPDSISGEIKKSLIDICVKITSLSEKQFYDDGGQSFEEFNKLGDEAVILVETCIGEIVKNTQAQDT